jgi:hypothetical protein
MQHVAVATEKAIRDINNSSASEGTSLAEAFMWVAWPTLQAQNQ